MEEKEKLEEEVVTPIAEEPELSAPEGAPEIEAKPAGTEENDDKKPISKKKKILNAVFLGVQIVLVVFAIILTLIMILNPKSDEVSSVGIKLMPVLSESMDGSTDINGTHYEGFPKWALVIAKTPENGGEDLQVGDIVTFSSLVEDSMQLVTHRIVAIEYFDGVKKYQTRGDANPLPDSTLKLPGDIQAVYVTHINGLGKALWWIREGYNFIYVIIIPLGLLLIYNIYLVAQIVVEGKMKKAKAAAAESAKQAALASIDEEEIKRRAIEEYLRSQSLTPAGDKTDKPEGE